MLIRAPVKSSFRVYFPDEIRRRRLSHLHYTQSICLGKRLCVILILFGNVVSSLQSLQLYHHGPLLQLVAFFIALNCTAFFNGSNSSLMSWLLNPFKLQCSKDYKHSSVPKRNFDNGFRVAMGSGPLGFLNK